MKFGEWCAKMHEKGCTKIKQKRLFISQFYINEIYYAYKNNKIFEQFEVLRIASIGLK